MDKTKAKIEALIAEVTTKGGANLFQVFEAESRKLDGYKPDFETAMRRGARDHREEVQLCAMRLRLRLQTCTWTRGCRKQFAKLWMKQKMKMNDTRDSILS